MKTIIVATDFSEAARNAAIYATNMANSIQADIFLLHVYEPFVPHSEVPIIYNPEDLKKEAEREINLLKNELTKLVTGNVKITSDVRIGTFYTDLQATCESLMPHMVIIGSQGKTAAERLFYGSHAVYAMKHLHWPLLTVPAKARFSSLKKICFASDLHEVAETIPVDEMKSIVGEFNAELHILNTDDENMFDPEIVFESGVLKRMFGNVEPVYHFISQTDPDKDIIDFCVSNKIDLLIVLPKRHSLIDKLMNKSHTRTLVLHSPVPVLALHK